MTAKKKKEKRKEKNERYPDEKGRCKLSWFTDYTILSAENLMESKKFRKQF